MRAEVESESGAPRSRPHSRLGPPSPNVIHDPLRPEEADSQAEWAMQEQQVRLLAGHTDPDLTFG